MLRAVDVAAELAAFFLQFANACQREYLEATGVCEDRAVPCIELMQSTSFSQNVKAWSQIEVIGVAQDNLCFHLFAKF